MQQCPNCRADNLPDSRFCAECGTRLDAPADQPTTPARATDRPSPPAGKKTIVLNMPEIAPVDRPPGMPAPDKTIVAGAPAAMPATDTTIVAEAPTAPGSAASIPTSALSPASPGSSAYVPPTLPPAVQARKAGGSRFWLLIALVALLACGMLAAVASGVLMFTRTAGSPANQPTPEVGGGLARLPTAEARPTVPPKPTTLLKPTAPPKPTAIGGGFSKVLLKDTFDDPKRSSLAAEENDTAAYSFVDGAYAITLKLPKHIAWSNFDGSYTDIAVDVNATLDSGPEESAAGIIFRYQDEDNFYFYRVAADGSYNLTLYKQGDQQALIDWTDSPAINGQGQTNHLRIETAGDRIRLFVNDTLLDEVSDESFGDGQIALAANTFSQGGATFVFDNLVVRGRS